MKLAAQGVQGIRPPRTQRGKAPIAIKTLTLMILLTLVLLSNPRNAAAIERLSPHGNVDTITAQNPQHAGSRDSAARNQSLDKTVEVSRAFRPTLPKEEKRPFAPQLVDSVRNVRPPFDYTLIGRPMLHDATMRPIPPAKLGREKAAEARSLYLKFGFGGYVTTLGEVIYSQRFSDRFSLGAFATHRGAFGRIQFPDGRRDVAQYSRTGVGVQTTGVVKNLLLTGDVVYHHTLSSFYGRQDTLMILQDPLYGLKNHAHTARVNLSIKNLNTDRRAWHYDGLARLNTYHDTWHMGELHGQLQGNLSKGLGEDYLLGGSFRMDLWQLKSPEQGSQHHTLVSLYPWVEWSRHRWRLRGGVDLTLGKNRGRFEFGLYPKAYFGYAAIEDYLVPFIESEGGMDGNGYGAVREMNRWVRPGALAWSTSRKLDLRAGLSGAAKHLGLSYRGWVGFTLEDSALMFVNSTSRSIASLAHIPEAFFTSSLEIEQANLQVLHAHAEVGYHLRELFNFSLRADYHGYHREGNHPVWHRPKVEAALTGEFNLREKIVVGMEFYFEGGAKARALDGHSIALSPLYDLNLYARYRFVEWAGIYLNAHNIINCRYYRYYLYPQHRFNVQLGMIFRI